MKTNCSTSSKLARLAAKAGLGVMLIFSLPGCVGVMPVPSSDRTYGKVISSEQVKFIVPSQTTRAEVAERLGGDCRESSRAAAVAYSWETPASDWIWWVVCPYGGVDGYFDNSHWRAFFLDFNAAGRVRHTEFVNLSRRKSLDEQLEGWARHHGATETNVGRAKFD